MIGNGAGLLQYQSMRFAIKPLECIKLIFANVHINLSACITA